VRRGGKKFIQKPYFLSEASKNPDIEICKNTGFLSDKNINGRNY
jgi:hypothetical protein